MSKFDVDFEAICWMESERITTEISDCLKAGFEIWNWWSEPLQPYDETRTFGCFVLVKRRNLASN